MSWSKLREIVKFKEAWYAAVHGVAKSQTRLNNWTTRRVKPKVNNRLWVIIICWYGVIFFFCCLIKYTIVSDVSNGGGSRVMWEISVPSSQLSLFKKSIGLLCSLNGSAMPDFWHDFDHLENSGSELCTSSKQWHFSMENIRNSHLLTSVSVLPEKSSGVGKLSNLWY